MRIDWLSSSFNSKPMAKSKADAPASTETVKLREVGEDFGDNLARVVDFPKAQADTILKNQEIGRSPVLWEKAESEKVTTTPVDLAPNVDTETPEAPVVA